MFTLADDQNLTQGPQKRISEALGAARLTLGQRVLVDRAVRLAYLVGLTTGLEAATEGSRDDPRGRVGPLPDEVAVDRQSGFSGLPGLPEGEG